MHKLREGDSLQIDLRLDLSISQQNRHAHGGPFKLKWFIFYYKLPSNTTYIDYMIISRSYNVFVLTYIIVFGVDWSSSCKSANKFLMTKATVALLAAVMSASVWRAYNGIRYAFYVLSIWCVKSKNAFYEI